MMNQADGAQTFSIGSDAYASFRPRYPPELFAWIASQCSGHDSAWDCATGNGQGALGLSRYFRRVEATDISLEQIAQGFPVANVRYSVQPAEQTSFGDAGFDLVTVAQALHWFDLTRFWAEVRRTSKPGAFFCAWGHAWFDCDTELEASFFAPLRKLLEPYWAPANDILWRGYRTEEILFPFERVDAPHFAVEVRWDMEHILANVGTWSAYKAAMADPASAQSIASVEKHAVERFEPWGAIRLASPLAIVAGYVS